MNIIRPNGLNEALTKPPHILGAGTEFSAHSGPGIHGATDTHRDAQEGSRALNLELGNVQTMTAERVNDLLAVVFVQGDNHTLLQIQM
eukprot:9183996-Pyramimonas_sp.AAC.1